MTDSMTIFDSLSPLGLVGRATIFLSAALALAWLTRRGPAGIRHLLWTTTFALLLGLPVLNLLGPSWELPLLPATPSAPVTPPPGADPIGEAATGSATPSAAFDRSVPSDGFPSAVSDRSTPVGGLTSLPGPAESPPTPSRSIPLPLLLWAMGCSAALLSLGVGSLRFRRLVRVAHPVRDPIRLRQVDAVRERLEIRGPVRLHLSAGATTPMTGGLWRPAVLLPASAKMWSAERWRIVLTHELIHVRRRDALRQLLSGVVLALYWFHPLSWIAFRLAAATREEACDEEVLALGTRPSDYAGHLLSLAGPMSARRRIASIAMVQHPYSRLERRIMAILKPNRPCRSSIATAVMLTVVAGVGVSTAVCRPVPMERVAEDTAQVPVPPPGLATGGAVDKAGADPASAEPREVAPIEGRPRPEDAGMEGGRGLKGLEPKQVEPVDKAGGRGAPPPSAGSAVGEGTESVTGVGSPKVAQGVESVTIIGSRKVASVTIIGSRKVASGNENAQEVVCDPLVLANSLPHLTMNVRGGNLRRMTFDGGQVIQKQVGDVRLCMRIQGKVVMTDDGTGVRAMDVGSWIVLESEDDELHRLAISKGRGGMEYEWSIDGHSRSFDAEAREWRDRMFGVLGAHWEIWRIRSEVASLRGRIASHRGRVASLRGRIASHRGRIASLRGRIASHRGRVASLRGRIASHRGRAASLAGRIASHKGRVASLRGRIASHKGRVASLRGRRSTYRFRISALRSAMRATSNAKTREALREEIEEWEERDRELQRELEIEGSEVADKIADLEAQIEDYDLDEKIAPLRAQIEDLEAGAAGEIADLEAQIEDYDLDGKMAPLRAQIDDLDLDAAGKIADLEAQIEDYDLDGKVRDIERKIADLDADRRVEAIERSIQEAVKALLRLIRKL